MTRDIDGLPLGAGARVLVPVALPDPPDISPWLMRFLEPVEVLLLGCYVVPEQTSPEQARDQFGGEAGEQIEEVVDQFRRAGVQQVDSEVVFTPDFLHTVERVAGERQLDAILRPGPVEQIDSVLGVVTRSIDFDRFIKCLGALTEESVGRVRLLQIDPDQGDAEERELELEGIKQRLVERGIEAAIIETETLTDLQAESALEVSEDFDLVIAAERSPTVGDHLFGSPVEGLLEEVDGPVLVVRLGEEE